MRPASAHDPTPIGDWQVKGVAYNPPFAFDPALPRAISVHSGSYPQDLK
jgi:hypothetical protein